MRIMLLAVSLVALAGPVYAQSGDRCHNYASEMLANDARGRQARCKGWNNHSNYNGHYTWCQRQTPARTNQALSNWRSRLQACQFRAGR